MSIQVQYLDREQLNNLSALAAASLLCVIGYGVSCPDWVPIGCPFAQLAMKPLTSLEYEVWTASSRVRYDAARGFAVARAPGVIMALMEPDQLATQPLDAVAEDAYGRIFDLIDGAEQSLLRVWNYLPGITAEEDGTERYRRFNTGRAQAFANWKSAPSVPPAASALGSAGGDVLIYFLAGEAKAIAIENPRQVSAYDYPPQYGPRSPTFSRATLVVTGRERTLFVSGTASIVGHESRHRGDVAAQTHETAENLRIVMVEAQKQGFTADKARMRFKVYLRNPDDLDAVRTIVRAEFPGVRDMLFLHAEICRPELLVEIEAMCPGV